MTDSLINPADSLERQNQKLLVIAEALMRRAEMDTDQYGAAYAQFERAAVLEGQVKDRTRDLEEALDLLNQSNARLADANQETEAARVDLANAIEAIQEGFALFAPDDRMVMCNSRFGMHLKDIKPQLVPGLSFAAYTAMVSTSRHLSLPEGVTPGAWTRNRRKQHARSHSMFNVRLRQDRWLQISEHRTPNGGTVILQTDVTDIMRLEREERDKLLDNQARLIRATLEHINQGVCIFDSNARLIGWNGRLSELLTLPLSQIRLGSGFDVMFERLRAELIFPDQDLPDQVLDWVRKKNNRPPKRFEIRRRGGVVLDVFAQEMPDGGFVISFTDVTAERRSARALFEANELLEHRVTERTIELEEALSVAERANASKSRFVAAASHDLLQPLSAAKLYMASLNADDRPPQDRTIIEKAQSALASVEGILDALLDISKLEAGRTSLDIASVDLGELMTGLRDEFAPAAALKGLRFRVVAPAVSVLSDPGYLRRIMQNLVANAVRYTESGKVLMGVRLRGETARLEVWDTGPGIAEEDRETIFREFQRLHRRASASEGMGLGLAIVERACSRLGHPLELRSEPGRGTVFSVTVPLTAPDVAGPASPPRDQAVRPFQDRGLIVLLVENDQELSRAMTMLLERWRIEVLSASDAEEALTLLDEIGIEPDAALVDYRLDGERDGLELIALLGQRFGGLPCRLISAERSAELRQRCHEGGVELLNKPIDTATLEAFLDRIQPRPPVAGRRNG
ncbi:hybrid sensor histidine kinase/response regulator [Brevirhabdus pacifica]|uniref:histidine kinase n=1 Tax=Brevirhabdus pacifica TaxID=1267768 RepID=A0A1U7DG93_9RHOB|nr:PAS-domain containing protein [Brevirhabdus pacifica]APX88913.1 hybrid sensor histidine kinase/response regulator [Brevirhabdus pacifica]OWU80142.1 histidine kinase [Loktanella sp. 22II-4b]PJJ86539.1 signal transduction histidine kinase [Brevirhabdus pacifica]